jgi:integrase
MDNASALLDLSWSVQPREGRAWVVMFRWKGRQVAVTTLEHNEVKARARAPEVIARWFKKNGEKVPLSRDATLSQAAAEFLEARYLSRKASTAKEARVVLERLAGVMPEGWAKLTRKTAKPYWGKLKGAASPKYWKNILTITRKFWRWAVEEGLATEDATEGLEGPRSMDFGIRKDIWTEEEVEAVVGALEAREAKAVMILRWTGLDPADLWNLRKRHFVKDKSGAWKIVKVREKAKSEKEIIDQPVSSKVRDLLMGLHAKAKGADTQVFPTPYRSAQVFTVLLRRHVLRAQAALGLRPLAVKSLRHTFATFHAERDVPIDVLRGWMGHTADSRVLDRVYLHRGSTARYMD